MPASGRGGGGKKKGEERKGGEEKGDESWNRAAEWLRPPLLRTFETERGRTLAIRYQTSEH